MATFLTNLQAASEHCNYGDLLELILQDCLVYGINDKTMQKRLLLEAKLTYKRAVELTQELEAADRDIKLLQSKREPESTPSLGVNRVAKTGSATPKTCYRCGSSGHLQASCKFPMDVVCHGCGKKGHIKRACCSSVSASIGKLTITPLVQVLNPFVRFNKSLMKTVRMLN